MQKEIKDLNKGQKVLLGEIIFYKTLFGIPLEEIQNLKVEDLGLDLQPSEENDGMLIMQTMKSAFKQMLNINPKLTKTKISRQIRKRTDSIKNENDPFVKLYWALFPDELKAYEQQQEEEVLNTEYQGLKLYEKKVLKSMRSIINSPKASKDRKEKWQGIMDDYKERDTKGKIKYLRVFEKARGDDMKSVSERVKKRMAEMAAKPKKNGSKNGGGRKKVEKPKKITEESLNEIRLDMDVDDMFN